MEKTEVLKRVLRILPDEQYIRLLYLAKFKKRLRLRDPKTFNEKLQWLKLHNRKPEYTTMVDKHEAKAYVAERIGDSFIIPTLGVWDSFDEIDFDALPDAFVLKCTHDSGGLVICRDKNTLDKAAAREKISSCLAKNYYWDYREWPYKGVNPRIIAETYLPGDGGELPDFKFMCFNGKVKSIMVCSQRGTEDGLHVTNYDPQWNVQPFERGYPIAENPVQKPQRLEEMIRLAEQLAEGIPYLRVDFYETQGKIYFGELTFFPGSGYSRFRPREWDEILGSWIRLPEKKASGERAKV